MLQKIVLFQPWRTPDLYSNLEIWITTLQDRVRFINPANFTYINRNRYLNHLEFDNNEDLVMFKLKFSDLCYE